MVKLIYSMITSLDGYAEDEEGNFDWAEPDKEVHLCPLGQIIATPGAPPFCRPREDPGARFDDAHHLLLKQTLITSSWAVVLGAAVRDHRARRKAPWQPCVRATKHSRAPELAIGADRRLVVTATDGTVKIYRNIH